MNKLAILLFVTTLPLATVGDEPPLAATSTAASPVTGTTPSTPTRTQIMDVTDRPPPPCTTRMTKAANPDDFYPAAAKAEQRQGAPVVRATIRKDQTTPDSIDLITSSNHPDLDEAAILVAKASRYTTTCAVGAVKFRVKFVFSPPASSNHTNHP